MVSDASAMLVATTTLRALGGAGSKMRVCISLGSALYTGRMSSCGMSAVRARACMRSCRMLHA